MAKVKQILLGIVLACLLLGSGRPAAAQQPTFTSNQFTQPDVVNTAWEIDQTIPETYILVGENDLFQLYANQETLGFKVLDRRSGYVWHSSLDEKGKTDRLNKAWTAFAVSGISIEYLDAKAVNKRISITNAIHTLDFKPIEQGFSAQVAFTDFGITLGVVVRLEAQGVSVELPFEMIKEENPDFKLGLVYVYPFFGATRGDSVPGYMFIPDGAGSLIRFSAETKAKNMYYQRYYGPDLGMITSLPYDPTVNRAFRPSIPVTGMVHGYQQNAYLAIVEKGAAYGEVQAHPSGVITNFNFIYNAFVYNESFFQATNRSGAGVTTLQKNTNAYDIKIAYRFLTGTDSDYVGMAKSYQQFLVEQGSLKKSSETSQDIGIRLEFLGGEKERVLLWDRLIPMTTISQMEQILTDLAIKNPDVVYYGWQPMGASSMPPKSLKVDGGLGSLDQLRSLVSKISADGGNFSLYLDPQAAIWFRSGYSPRNDLAMSITNANLSWYNRNKANYYLNLAALTSRYPALSKDVFSELQAGLALDGIGSIVYSDFKPGHVLNRQDAILAYQKLMTDNPGKTAFYQPNDYMFPYVQAYYDMPLTNSGYIYTTDVVPFLQIVFAGYVPYYGPALNFSSNARDDLLRHVDFGVYPSYFLTNDETAKILLTSSNWIYTSSYRQWSADIKQNYQWLDDLLKPVLGQPITARQVLAAGVVATTYANGKQIVTNYTDQPYRDGDLSVNAKDAVIREVQP